MGLEPVELARWSRFAAKGGIGKCTATCDCVAESADDLMFMKDDEITVLLQFHDKEGQYLGYCEGVVGRFSGTDVVFHSKLKKPVITKRGSTHSTLSVAHSLSNLSNSPTPTTPTTPTVDGSTPPPSRPSSSRRTPRSDDMLSVKGDRSQSQSPLGHTSVNANTNLRSVTQDIPKSGGLQYSMQSPRDYHFASSVHEDTHIEGSTSRTTVNSVRDSSQNINCSGLVDDLNISLHTLASSTLLSTSTHVVSPSTHQPSTPTIPSPSSSAEKDQEGKINTAPLRIMKRTASNPDSPLLKTTFQFTSVSPSSSPHTQPSIVDTPDFLRSNATTLFENPDANCFPSTSPTKDDRLSPSLALSLQFGDISSDALTASSVTKCDQDGSDEAPQSSATPSALDTSATADSTFDDLTSSHPERFSRFSMGPALSVSALLGMPGQKPAPKEGEGGLVQKPVFVTPSDRHTAGRASLSIAARGKVDEATLASTQAQVGIGLSLLQDLVGGMDSDSESGSDYEASDDERIAQIKETSSEDAEEGGYTGGGVSARESLLTEESTIDGLMYASGGEVDHQGAVTRDGTNGTTDAATRSSFTDGTDSHRRTPTSPTIPKVPLHSAPSQTHRQPNEPNNAVDLSTRERRPSLAPSVVSGKSGTSGSWDGDIYDNYRYSSFSMRSGAGRPSSDSMNGRMKPEGIIEENSFGDMESTINSKVSLKKSNRITLNTGGLQRRSISLDFDDSIYSQDSGLSNLSREFAAIPLPGLDSLTEKRPPPLSITGHSPLLHTDWASAGSSSTSGVQTTLSPSAAGVYTPPAGRFDLEVDAKMGISLPARSKDDGGAVGEHTSGLTGMASAMRYRLETERQSPLPEETHDDDERNDTSASLGLGSGIVVQDNEELPSRIFADEGDHGDSDDVDFFSVSHEGNVEGTIIALSPEPSNTMKDRKQEVGQSRNGIDSQSVVSTRSSSPTSSNGDGEPSELQLNAVLPYQVSNVPASPERTQPPPTPPSQQGPSIDTHQLRQRNTQPVGPEGRRSLFLPHPNAPKAPAGAPLNVEPGAGIGAVSKAYRRFAGQGPLSGTESLHQGNNLPPQPRPPVQAVIHMALSMGPRIIPPTPGRPSTRILPTIYGRTEADLSTSVGPVPIAFSVDPPPITTGSKATAPKGAALPSIGAGGLAVSQDTRTRPTSPPSNRASPPGQQATLSTQSPPLRSFSSFSSSIKSAIRPATSPGSVTLSSPAEKKDNGEDNKPNPPTQASPIPRPNFTSKAPGLRPRSRSFSGFNSDSTQDRQPLTPNLEGKQESNKVWPKRTILPPISNSVVSSSGPKSPTKSSPLRPSPLSISSVSATDLSSVAVKMPSATTTRGITPTSPLAHNVFVLSTSQSLPSAVLKSNTRREQGQRAQSTSSSHPPIISTGLSQRSALKQKSSGSLAVDGPSVSTPGLAPFDQRPMFPVPTAGKTPTENTVKQGSTVPDEPSIVRQTSLRAKLSLPNLRKNRNQDDDTIGVFDRDLRDAGGKLFDGERSSLQGKDRPKEVVQVKDMEFEFVRPSLSIQQRNSEDSLVIRHENPFESRPDGLLQPASPTISLSSSDLRSPILESYASGPHLGNNLEASTPAVGPSESIEAHRQRELKWVSLMSSSPASLSRKSKKVKKLLVEGVPSSVRYLIWSYLTDGKGRAVKGVYEQLCQRGEVTRTRDIAADAERLFGMLDGEVNGIQYLHATKGAVIVLLQAYFSMVPDVRYSTGLTKIVGQLLLLAPEEDAFWIFTSIMDTHLRPYFSIPAQIPSSGHSNSVFRSTQMEVDSALYSRALEAADSPLSKKLFVDLGILPGVVCQGWFTSLFVGALPLDYINRVWDVFLYEGIPFLLRVALCLTFTCRQFLLSPTTNTEGIALAALARPPIQWLPPSPEAFLTTAMNVKLKDDDIRKQRLKMGEIVKRQTQAQQGPSAVNASGISLPRV